MVRKVKATHVINIINYVKSKKGKLGLDRLWEKMEEKKGEIDKEYDENQWVEYSLVQEFFDAIEEEFGTEMKQIPRARDIGRHISENLGHLEYLTRASGLKEMIKKAQDGWSQVYNFGELELADWDEQNNKAILRYHEFPEDENVCNYFQGSLEKDLELLDLDGEVEHTDCPLEGSDHMEFTLKW